MSSKVAAVLIVIVLVGGAVAWLASVGESRPRTLESSNGSPGAAQPAEIARALKEAWPDRPEWLDMYTAIIDDEKIGPNYGWFRTAVTQTRFGWESTRKRYDRDGDGSIARNEFSGSDAEFGRLDRDRDRLLSSVDFDFLSHYSYVAKSAILTAPGDQDVDGKALRKAPGRVTPQSERKLPALWSKPQPDVKFEPASWGILPGERPSKTALIRMLFHQEMGSLQPGPKLEESAPDFTLKTSDGKSELTLSKLIGTKPVVLLFGNFTCGQFRNQADTVETLHLRYGDRASFVMVYVRESHPIDGWWMESKDHLNVPTVQPTTYEERSGVAQFCLGALGFGFPMLVDTIDDAVGVRYSAMPGRFYLIDRHGKIAFKNGRGPFGLKPDELEHSLILLLQEEASAPQRQARL